MDKEYIIRFSSQDLQTLSMAVAEMPFRLAAPLIEKINRQIAPQQGKTGDNSAEAAQEEK